MDDWKKICEGLIYKVEELLLQDFTPTGMQVKCRQCGIYTAHEFGRPDAVFRITDFIIEQMNIYQLKITKEMGILGVLLQQANDEVSKDMRTDIKPSGGEVE